MKNLLLSLAALAALAAPQMAGAITISAGPYGLGNQTIDFDSETNGSTADIVTGFGATVSMSGGAHIQNNTDSNGAQPFDFSTPNYLTVVGNSEATIEFDVPQTYLGLLWGSVDTYNSIKFTTSAGDVVFGGGVIPINPFGDQGEAGTRYVNFFSDEDLDGFAFTKVTFSSGVSNSFEFDNVSYNSAPVPEGGATLALLGSLMGGMMIVRRFKK